jgi:hypothetical protein
MGDDRDRDEFGRPLNARPRDGLGRPLPHGSPGVDRPPITRPISPDEALIEAQRLLDDGMPFHAHEVLEEVWKSAPEPERALWRGLAQLAVGLTHAGRGNTSGASALLRRGAVGIDPYRERPPHGVDVAGLRRWADGLADRLAVDPGPLAVDTVAPRLCARPSALRDFP